MPSANVCDVATRIPFSEMLQYSFIKSCSHTDFVNLKILSNRTPRSTDTSMGGITSVYVNIISLIVPMTTKQSNRLDNETKYPCVKQKTNK